MRVTKTFIYGLNHRLYNGHQIPIRSEKCIKLNQPFLLYFSPIGRDIDLRRKRALHWIVLDQGNKRSALI